MKKLYTLLLAAAVALSATAATPFQSRKESKMVATNAEVREAKAPRLRTLDLNKLGLSADDFAKPSSRADEMPVFDDYFMQLSYTDTVGTGMLALPCHIYEDSSAPSGSGTYLIDNFFMNGSKQVWATIENVTYNLGTEDNPKPFECTVLRIAGEGLTTVKEENGVKYGLWLAGYKEDPEDGQTYLYRYGGDIDFVMLKDGSFVLLGTFFGDDRMGLAMRPDKPVNGRQALYDLTFGHVINACNGAYYDKTYSEDAAGNGSYDDFSTLVYAEFNQDMNILLITNFAGYGSAVPFLVDTANNEASAAVLDNIVAPYMDEETGDVKTVEFSYYLTNDLQRVTPVIAKLSNSNGKSTVTITDETYIVRPVVEELNFTKPAIVGIFKNSVTVLDFEIPGMTGISNVTVADENAPVEYYNLQGVRVENPANGLYIKRQGKTATKVFVK